MSDADDTKTGRELRPLAKILTDLEKKPAGRHLSTKKQGGAEITFMTWSRICDYLDHHAPGWEWDIKVTVGHDRLYVVGSLTLNGFDEDGDRGQLTRMATGTEKLDKDTWGDPSSVAEAMALRRAACKFGFCRYLWQ